MPKIHIYQDQYFPFYGFDVIKDDEKGIFIPENGLNDLSSKMDDFEKLQQELALLIRAKNK